MSLPIDSAQVVHTTAEWQSLNPVLALDVIGIEVMTNGYNRYKRGNGTIAWTSLSYIDKVYDSGGNLIIDTTPTSGSGNPVSSGGVFDALDEKQDKTNNLTTGSTLSDADQLPFYDASTSSHLKVLWSTIKSTLKTYFDSIYSAVTHYHSASDITSGTLSTSRGGTGETAVSSTLTFTRSTTYTSAATVSGKYFYMSGLVFFTLSITGGTTPIPANTNITVGTFSKSAVMRTQFTANAAANIFIDGNALHYYGPYIGNGTVVYISGVYYAG